MSFEPRGTTNARPTSSPAARRSKVGIRSRILKVIVYLWLTCNKRTRAERCVRTKTNTSTSRSHHRGARPATRCLGSAAARPLSGVLMHLRSQYPEFSSAMTLQPLHHRCRPRYCNDDILWRCQGFGRAFNCTHLSIGQEPTLRCDRVITRLSTVIRFSLIVQSTIPILRQKSVSATAPEPRMICLFCFECVTSDGCTKNFYPFAVSVFASALAIASHT